MHDQQLFEQEHKYPNWYNGKHATKRWFRGVLYQSSTEAKWMVDNALNNRKIVYEPGLYPVTIKGKIRKYKPDGWLEDYIMFCEIKCSFTKDEFLMATQLPEPCLLLRFEPLCRGYPIATSRTDGKYANYPYVHTWEEYLAMPNEEGFFFEHDYVGVGWNLITWSEGESLKLWQNYQDGKLKLSKSKY